MKTPGRALVTGANRGLGWWLSKALIARGWEVWGTARRPDAAESLVALGVAGVLPFDAAGGDAAADALVAALATAGVPSLDLLVNNAGTKPAELQPELAISGIDGLTTDIMLDVYRINTVMPVILSQRALPLLRAADDGAVVVNLSSNLASHSRVVGDDLTYSSSKTGLNMLCHMLGRDLVADGIAVVAFSPGWSRTDMGGPLAPLDPEETMIAAAATIEKFGPHVSGRFLDYNGDTVPW